MSRKFINIKDVFEEIKNKRIVNWIDKLTFTHILLMWLLIIVLFGFVYYFFRDSASFLFYLPEKRFVNEIKEAVYFSFVTTTTTGFGDIIPLGLFRAVAISEVLLGVMLLALVTSKLVSIKQNVILGELYESAFNDKINRLRSSLLLFRQNLHRLMNKIEEGSIRKREIDNIYMYASSFEDTLNETINLITKSDNHNLTKGIDPVNTELIFNSILNSFETLNELITVMNQRNIEWKRDINLKLINSCIAAADNLFSKLNFLKNLTKQTVNDMNERKNKIIAAIKSGL